MELEDVIVDEVAVRNCLLIVVAVDDVLEVRLAVSGWCCREPNLGGVEVVDRVPPNGKLARCVAAMALVCDHHLEGVVRDVELSGVVVLPNRVGVFAEDGLLAEEVMAIRWIVET